MAFPPVKPSSAGVLSGTLLAHSLQLSNTLKLFISSDSFCRPFSMLTFPSIEKRQVETNQHFPLLFLPAFCLQHCSVNTRPLSIISHAVPNLYLKIHWCLSAASPATPRRGALWSFVTEGLLRGAVILNARRQIWRGHNLRKLEVASTLGEETRRLWAWREHGEVTDTCIWDLGLGYSE